MLKKSIITIILLSIVLSSCTSQDNRNNNQQSENVQLVPASQAYDSCEELLGKEYNKFSLPKKISPKSYEHIYTLQCNVQENKVSENSIKEIYKKFYNSSYDENKLINDQNGGIIYQEGDNASNYWGLDVSLMSPAYKFLEYKENENPIKEYFISDIQGDASFAIDITPFNQQGYHKILRKSSIKGNKNTLCVLVTKRNFYLFS